MTAPDPSVLSIAFTDRRLCTRCGTCVGVCPEGALSVDPETFFPVLDEAKCTRCGLCAKTCPGGRLSYGDLTELTFGHRKPTPGFDGHVLSSGVAHAGDAALREGGAGGGVITALLADQLRRGAVDGCIVTRMMRDRPWHGEPYIARTVEELRESQQSRYIVIPLNAILQTIREQPGRYALAGLPCHIHGLRLAAQRLPWVRERIRLTVGLFCASALEPYVVRELLAARGLDPRAVRDVRFRDGDWPGAIRAVMNDGRRVPLHQSNFKDGAINYLTYLYIPPRCATCIDGSSEFADVAVSDAWTRNSKGEYLFRAHSRMLARTPAGAAAVAAAVASGALVWKDVSNDPAYQTHRHHTRKKRIAANLRAARRAARGGVAPIYDRPPPEAASKDRLLERIETALMAVGRVGFLRRPLIAFLTSRWGLPLIRLRQRLKERRYRGSA